MNATRHPNNQRRAKRTAGFAMIEVLVAVLLFAIGILGLVGLQASMTHAQTESKVRADAANLVDELAALMWSEVGTNIGNLVAFKTAGCGGNLRCAAWQTKVGEVLPSGTLDALTFDETVTDTTSPDHGMVTVTLKWALPNGAGHQYIATFNVAPSGI